MKMNDLPWYTLAPGQNHSVEVAGALEGMTVANAVRFVSAGTSAPGINYVHTDSFGQPLKDDGCEQGHCLGCGLYAVWAGAFDHRYGHEQPAVPRAILRSRDGLSLQLFSGL